MARFRSVSEEGESHGQAEWAGVRSTLGTVRGRRAVAARADGRHWSFGGATILGGQVSAPNAASAAPRAQQESQRIRKLQLLVQPQASVPEEYEGIQIAASQLKQIGLDIDVKPMPWEQMSDLVWFQRGDWDMTAWQMVGRPERLDPDEFVYNLFHSSTAEDGYNFVGYINPEYDKLAEAQRAEMDHEKRREILYQAQQVIADDQPYIFFVYPHESFAYNSAIWDPSSIVDFTGIGIKNFWTFVRAAPLGDQKDMVLNTQAVVQAINPLYISGATDSWITELLWDRLMRVGPDGLPQPYAAKSLEWQDDVTALVTLRPDMTWHDGQPVTVDDVIFSFQAPAGDMSPMYKPFVDPDRCGHRQRRQSGRVQAEGPVCRLRDRRSGEDQSHPEARLGAGLR